MLPDPYLLDALYQARRRDELGTVEIDSRHYRIARLRPIRIGQLPRAPLHVDLGASIRRIAMGRKLAPTAS